MKLSTRGRYAVMAMADMAQQQKEGRTGPFRLSEIAKRQEISLHYLEQIFGDLRRADLVTSQRGAHGGYHLAQSAGLIRIGDVIGAVDEPLDVTRCQISSGCLGNHARCLTHDLWAELSAHIHSFLNGISLADVVDGHKIIAPEPLFCEQISDLRSVEGLR
ncbi:RrF2 family transcriptional regulator [Alphaproteobacteria bacterium]|nr:RrF2 family transcriptional regulator [Alphaproteobacteria bacterium]